MIIIRCDSDCHVLGAIGLSSPARFWSFNLGNIAAYTYNYTDVIDLGKNHSYSHFVAKKIGDYSYSSYLEIQCSPDGAKWVPAFGAYGSIRTARNENSSSIFGVWGRTLDRYVRVLFRNGDTAQNNLIIELTAFTGV